MGCYGIFNANGCLFVGRGAIRQRLLDHLNGDRPRILENVPTYYLAEVTGHMDDREKELVAELHPTCNQAPGYHAARS